jgi:hypothetical protein
VLWYADDRKPNSFFLRSPFRSWRFLINVGLAIAVSLTFATVLWKYWDQLSQGSARCLTLSTIFMQSVVYPFRIALRRRRKVSELFEAGYLAEQKAGSPLDEVLEVADDAINEALGNNVFTFGLILVAFVVLKLR